MARTTKEEINGSPLYFFKKAQVVWAIISQMVTIIVIVLGAYYSLRADVTHNTESIIKNTVAVENNTSRLDKKHDEILELKFRSEVQTQTLLRLERNFEDYMKSQGFRYNRESVKQ